MTELQHGQHEEIIAEANKKRQSNLYHCRECCDLPSRNSSSHCGGACDEKCPCWNNPEMPEMDYP